MRVHEACCCEGGLYRGRARRQVVLESTHVTGPQQQASRCCEDKETTVGTHLKPTHSEAINSKCQNMLR